MASDAAGLPRAVRFDEIEGLRAWLAFAVVGWHVVQYTGLNARFALLASSGGVAHLAVELFIIVSGFVVTHLLAMRREPYSGYLVRRAFRLFPLYLALVLPGIATTALGAQAVMAVPWADDPGFAYRDTLVATYQSQQDAFPVHLLLHLLLFQGIVPDSVLPYSSAVMLGPAWSLSLEWQFYLIAPVVIGWLADRRRAAIMVALLLGAVVVEQVGLLGDYRLMSVFPAAAHLFLAGIASRLLFERAVRIRFSPVAAALVGVALAAAVPALAAIGLWVAFYAFLAGRGAVERTTAVDRAAARIWSAMFGSAAARWVGARSYGIYLAHWPVLQVTLFLLRDTISADTALAALTLAAIVVPASLALAAILHIALERPMIRLGAQIAGRRARQGMVPATAGRDAGKAG
ncbi:MULTISPECIES: acyltransferase family protein [unclassified Sphingomonas]|uniref:acyltransferase family protein n=1 Tax=unclassified Sphingomonas TaxID=196159 RepID=UPI000AC466B7|nr:MULTISPECIES: acyltransferase [unclassified Sphingomonas]